MTIRVTVKNEDSRETAVIAVQYISPEGSPISGYENCVLIGGESAEMQVHANQQLLIKEVSQ